MKFNKTQARKLLSFKVYIEKICDGETKTRLPLQIIRAMVDCYNEIVEIGKTETFQKDVADRFLDKGFKVKRDENNVNYIISV